MKPAACSRQPAVARLVALPAACCPLPAHDRHHPRPREDQSRPPRARHAARRLPRAAHGLPGDLAARHDHLRPRATGPFAIECDTAGVPLDRVESGLEAPPRRCGGRCAAPARCATWLIRLDKRIPLQAGLGGGSADAAATLLALARAWRVPVRPAQLTDVAATLGADVPFFLAGGTALGLGRGDEIYPLADLPRHWIVLLIPGFGVSSGDAYRWYDEEREPGPGPCAARTAVRARALAVARGADDQRPRGADCPPPSRDRPDEGGAAAGRVRWPPRCRAAARPFSACSRSGPTRRGRSERLSGSGWRVVLTESLGREAYAKASRPVPGRVGGGHREPQRHKAVTK